MTTPSREARARAHELLGAARYTATCGGHSDSLLEVCDRTVAYILERDAEVEQARQAAIGERDVLRRDLAAVLGQRASAAAREQVLREALERIASHDLTRHGYAADIARTALSTSTSHEGGGEPPPGSGAPRGDRCGACGGAFYRDPGGTWAGHYCCGGDCTLCHGTGRDTKEAKGER